MGVSDQQLNCLKVSPIYHVLDMILDMKDINWWYVQTKVTSRKHSKLIRYGSVNW